MKDKSHPAKIWNTKLTNQSTQYDFLAWATSKKKRTVKEARQGSLQIISHFRSAELGWHLTVLGHYFLFRRAKKYIPSLFILVTRAGARKVPWNENWCRQWKVLEVMWTSLNQALERTEKWKPRVIKLYWGSWFRPRAVSIIQMILNLVGYIYWLLYKVVKAKTIMLWVPVLGSQWKQR